jgi:hypothetical protein
LLVRYLSTSTSKEKAGDGCRRLGWPPSFVIGHALAADGGYTAH